jgi:hypothetical protein
VFSFDFDPTALPGVFAAETMSDAIVTYPPDPMFGFGTPFLDTESRSVGNDHVDIVAADFDADEDIDALVASSGGGPTYFRNQQGDGFSRSSLDLAEQPTALAAGDLDDDDDIDLAFTATATDRVVVMLQPAGSPTAEFILTVAATITVPDAPSKLLIADVDGAGRPEIVVAGATTVSVLRAAASGTSYTVTTPITLGAAPRSLAAADLDGDGHLDLAVGQPSSVVIYAGDGAGGFTLAHTVALAGDAAALLALAVNADSLPDLVTAETSANRVRLLINATVRETCDDGNTLDGDSCPADCTQP